MAWTYDSLTSAIQKTMENTATDFVAELPNIIRMAERRIHRETRPRAYYYTATITLSSGADTITTPTNLIQVRSVKLATANTLPLIPKHETWLDEYAPGTSIRGEPKYYSHKSETAIRFSPTPSQDYDINITYRAHPTHLSTDTTQTWLSVHGEDVLFYAAMVEASLNAKMFGDPGVGRSQIEFWEGKYQQALADFRKEHEGTGYSDEYRIGIK